MRHNQIFSVSFRHGDRHATGLNHPSMFHRLFPFGVPGWGWGVGGCWSLSSRLGREMGSTLGEPPLTHIEDEQPFRLTFTTTGNFEQPVHLNPPDVQDIGLWEEARRRGEKMQTPQMCFRIQTLKELLSVRQQC